jgi:hypothetical protein
MLGNPHIKGPMGAYTPAKSLLETPGWKALEAEENEMLPDSKRGGSFGFSAGKSTDPFHPENFPTSLDPLAGPSYGLPSIWQGDMTTAETNEWAAKMAVNPDIPQFMQNTFSDPMALRKGMGVYNMDFNNPLNRPAEQLTQEYRDKVAAFNSPENVARMQAGADQRRDIKSAAAKRKFAALGGGARNVISPLAARQSRRAIASRPTSSAAAYSNFGRGR